MTELRPYQLDVVGEIDRHERPLIVAPTGSGKTIIAAEIVRRSVNKHILFIAHRRELIRHARNKLAEFGITAGVILAGEPRSPMLGVQVASIQTLWARCVRGSTDLPPADLVFIDEAHHARARTYRQIVDAYPGAKIVGLTATPCRKDGRGLGGTFDAIIECPQVQELIALGHLVPTRVFAPSTPDLKGVQTRQGDYVEGQLAARVDRPELVGDIVSHWHRLAECRKTVVFATSVAHSVHLRDEFIKTGVRAEHIDGKTPKDERDEILRCLSAGEIELVTNCMVLTEGWDQPDVACCVLARPTKSLGLYRQMVGRVLRPAPNKTNALILDHAGAVFQHGFVEDPVQWTLDPDTKAAVHAHDLRSSSSHSRLTTCSQCSAIRTAGKPCPNCGFMPRRPGEHLDVRDGELAYLDRDSRQQQPVYSAEYKRQFHAGLTYLCVERGNKLGAAAHRFRDKFGHWPADRHVEPTPPTPEVLAWDRHCRIKFAKSVQARSNG
jgi:superfamily II DNA or RNA helicase